MFRNFVFTLNNYTEDECEQLRNNVGDNRPFIYLCAGFEVGESGTPHIQGVAQLHKPTRTGAISRIIPRAHIEKMRGTIDQAREYCIKDGHYEEHGTIRRERQRTDLKTLVSDIKESRCLRDVVDIAPEMIIRYPRGVQLLIELNQKPRDFEPTVVWLWGDTGSGKTMTAVNCESYYIKDNTKWWDGYGHEQRIIIDDFDSKLWDFRALLRLLDRYPYRGETKGGYTEINSREIYITCEFAPDTQYNGTMFAQLRRRITTVTHMESDAVPIGAI